MFSKLHQLFLTALILLGLATTAHGAIIGPGESGTVTFTDPLVLDPPTATGNFTHTYNFGFDLAPPTTQAQGSLLLNPAPGSGTSRLRC